MDLFPNDRLPIIPDSLLRTHKVLEPTDTRFRANARLLQSLWRDRAGFKIGTYIQPHGRRRHLGNRLAALPAAAGGNFLSSEIRHLARREQAYRAPGAQIDEARLWGNLLSSMPLAFNLFGHLKLHPDQAERFIADLCPDLAGKVVQIQFEHSPARGDPAFTADGTAFDVFITLRRPDGTKTFLAIETKYAESMTEPPARHRPRYDDLSLTSNLFLDPDSADLRANPLQQLWREHMLAHTLVSNQLYDAGCFVLLAPRLNNDVQRAASRYRQHLADPASSEPNPTTPTVAPVPFLNLTLEDAAETLLQNPDAAPFAQRFIDRYLDFAPVHALI
jgi:hypothetical protein